VETSSRQFADVIVAVPVGRVDHHNADKLEAALAPLVKEAADRKGVLVLDFAGVEYISSVGLRVLMLASRQVKAQDGRIAVAALKPLVKEVFEISRFNLVFRIFDTVEAASGSFA
jgi:anti-anti-sigma factor